MLFKIIVAGVFIAVTFAFSRLVAKPAADAGWLAVLPLVAVCLAIALWIDRRDKRKRQEVEQAALRAEAARLHTDITDSLRHQPGVIEGDFTGVNQDRVRR